MAEKLNLNETVFFDDDPSLEGKSRSVRELLQEMDDDDDVLAAMKVCAV